MLAVIVDLLRRRREQVTDRMAAEILRSVPRYAGADATALRRNISALFEDLLAVVELDDRTRLVERLGEISRARIEQGFSISDFLRALLLFLPVVRAVVRTAGPEADPAAAAGFASLEAIVHQLAATAADVYMSGVTVRLESKNRELNRLNQLLAAHERALESEVAGATRALEAASEFNRRVLESLSAGVLVVAAGTHVVTLYSSRLEEMLGIPAEEVLGREVTGALGRVRGLDLPALVRAVRTMGLLPLTKLRLELADGTARAVHVRAHRLRDADGAAEGTVVLVDDITERELLLDSLSRYVSRDVVERVLARGAVLGLEGEQRVCTILFADIRGFTRLGETQPLATLHALLNGYFHVITEAITRAGGFVDKFVGDKVMALFFGQADAAASARAALRAAGAIQRELGAQNEARRRAGEPAIEVGIGVNAGEVLLGNVGSEARMDFTAIGDAVNLADRLQEIARGGEVLVGEGVAALVGDEPALEPRGAVSLKGRSAPAEVWALR